MFENTMTAHEKMRVRQRLAKAKWMAKATGNDPFVHRQIEMAHEYLHDTVGMRDFIISHVEFVEDLAGVRRPKSKDQGGNQC